MKTKKYKKNKIHCHSRYVICLPFVIPTMPALEPTINIQKSGTWPVIPKTVVFKYFSWPAKSMNVITFEDSLQIWIQSSAPPLKFKISFILLKLYFRKQVFTLTLITHLVVTWHVLSLFSFSHQLLDFSLKRLLLMDHDSHKRMEITVASNIFSLFFVEKFLFLL